MRQTRQLNTWRIRNCLHLTRNGSTPCGSLKEGCVVVQDRPEQLHEKQDVSRQKGDCGELTDQVTIPEVYFSTQSHANGHDEGQKALNCIQTLLCTFL